jgi:hypothetical protein
VKKINKVEEEKGIAGFSVVEDICIIMTGVNNINNKY